MMSHFFVKKKRTESFARNVSDKFRCVRPAVLCTITINIYLRRHYRIYCSFEDIFQNNMCFFLGRCAVQLNEKYYTV